LFLKKLKNVLIVWLALLALLSIFSSLPEGSRDFFFLESSVVDGVVPALALFTSIQRGLGTLGSEYLFSTENRGENDRLKKQLIQLQIENLRLREAASAHERLRRLLQLKNELPEPTKVAEVVGRGPSPFLQLLFINKGRKEGLVRGMPVLLPQGVVGRVEKTAAHYSQVLLLNDPTFAVDCLVQRSRVRGVLTGIPGERNAQVKYVGRNEDIKPGDLIMTSGIDRLYPKGLMLGRVLRVTPQAKGSFLFVEVVPECRLSQIEEVLILQKRPPLPDQEGSGDD
jgi:rod shape-determining protein MreC